MNFFQAEMVGVVMPVLNALLRESHWRYGAIGMATAAAGRESDLDERIATGLTRGQEKEVKWTELFRNRTILFLFFSIFMFTSLRPQLCRLLLFM